MQHFDMVIKNHIAPRLGALPLSRVNRPRVQRWVNEMDGSPRSIRHRFAVLHNALEAAVVDGRIARNPCDGVALPELDAAETPVLSAGEVRRLLAGTVGDRLHAVWAVMVATGLRISEVRGLSWDDWQGNQLHVRAQLARRSGTYERVDGHRRLVEPGRWELVDPKAARTREALTLPQFAIAALEEHQRRMAAERKPEWPFFGLIFVTPRGMPYHEQAILAELYATEERLGLPRVWLHGLRHTNASLLAEGGVSEEVRMARLGHNTRAMARHYAKVGDVQDGLAADVLQRVVAN